MRNTIKPLTFLLILLVFPANLLAGALFMRADVWLSAPPLWLVSLLLVAYPVYWSFRTGSLQLADERPGWSVSRVVSTGGVVLILGLVGFLMIGSNERWTYHPLPREQIATIEGKYQANDAARSTAEFLGDGTLIFVSGGQQGVWKWSKVDGGRLKLDPGAGMLGTQAAVCDYSLSFKELRLLNCQMAVVLTRLDSTPKMTIH